MINATKVELKAIPKFSVINEILPAIALSAFDNANPMPMTVPIKPTEGLAHIKYLINFPINIQKLTLMKLVRKKPRLIAIGSPIIGSQQKNANKLPQSSIFIFRLSIFYLEILKYLSIKFQFPILPIP